VLCPEAIGDPAAKERFIREARAASAFWGWDKRTWAFQFFYLIK